MIVNLTDRRAEASRRRQLDLLDELGPDGIARELAKLEGARAKRRRVAASSCLPHLVMPAHHDVRPEDIVARRLHGNLAAAADRGPEDFAELLLVPGVGARTVRALAQVAEVVHGAPCRFSDPARFSLAHGGKDRHPYPGAAEGLRPHDRRDEVGGAQGEARPVRGAGRDPAARRAGAPARAPRVRPVGRGAVRRGARALARVRRHSVFGPEPPSQERKMPAAVRRS